MNLKLRCRFGFHRWQLFTMAWTFIRAFPEHVNVERRCRDCPAMQTVHEAADGVQRWVARL